MGTVDLARPTTLSAPRADRASSTTSTVEWAWSVCLTWMDILSSALTLTHALDAAPPSRRAALAAGWLDLLNQRFPH